MKKLSFLFLLALILPAPTAADGSFSISGFGFWVDESTVGEETENGNLRMGHVWLIGSRVIDPSTEVVIILAQKGSLNLENNMHVHNLHAIRKNVLPLVDEFFIGRFVPPILNRWSDIQINELGTVNYPSMTDSLVERDNGIQANIYHGGVTVNAGIFAGERTGGFARERNNTHRHVYCRMRYNLFNTVTVSAAYRWSTLDKKLWTAEFSWRRKDSLISFESLKYPGHLQWYAIMEKDIKWFSYWIIDIVSPVVQYEHLTGPNRTTFGARIHSGKTFVHKTMVAYQGETIIVQNQLIFQF